MCAVDTKKSKDNHNQVKKNKNKFLAAFILLYVAFEAKVFEK